MYHKYPILKFFATAPADAARYPHKYRCRVCFVELSLMTKGPLEILHHYRTDAHLIEERRIRMETPGLPLFNKNCEELSGMALKDAKERARREYPVAPKLGEYYLRLGQQEQAEVARGDNPSKEIFAQLNLLKIGLMHGGQITTMVALWHDLVKETKTSEAIVQHDWQPHSIFVSIFIFCSQVVLISLLKECLVFKGLVTYMFRELLSFCVDSIEASGSYSLRLTQYANETRLFVHFWARNSLYGLCIGVFPGRVFTPGTLLLLLSNFFALIGKDAHLLFMAGFAPRIIWTVS